MEVCNCEVLSPLVIHTRRHMIGDIFVTRMLAWCFDNHDSTHIFRTQRHEPIEDEQRIILTPHRLRVVLALP